MPWTPGGGSQIATANVATSTAAGVAAAARAGRRSVTVKNTDTSITVYLGGSGVTTGTGLPLLAGESITLETAAAVYAIAASGTPALRVVEIYD